MVNWQLGTSPQSKKLLLLTGVAKGSVWAKGHK